MNARRRRGYDGKAFFGGVVGGSRLTFTRRLGGPRTGTSTTTTWGGEWRGGGSPLRSCVDEDSVDTLTYYSLCVSFTFGWKRRHNLHSAHNKHVAQALHTLLMRATPFFPALS